MTGTAIIVGAGIGGLTAALCLAQRGWAVRVAEQATALQDVGAGIQQSPNAMRVHRALGTADALTQLGHVPERAVVRDGISGRELLALPLGGEAEARHGAPYLQLHRADLIGVLADACRRVGVAFEFGRSLGSYRADSTKTSALFTDGKTEACDLLVGADGIHSVIRAQMLGNSSARFTGSVAWRALVPVDAANIIPSDATSWTAEGRHLVTYPLRGGSLINVVGVMERAEWAEESWTQQGDPEAFRAAFAGWNPQVAGLLAAVDEAHLWGLFEHRVPARWSDGGAVLLGDAAHATLPFLAQGAAMAVEDAWVLGASLATEEFIGAGLRRYESVRAPRVARVQNLSRQNIALFHRRDGATGLLARAKLGLAGALPQLARSRTDWLYGYDPTTAPRS